MLWRRLTGLEGGGGVGSGATLKGLTRWCTMGGFSKIAGTFVGVAIIWTYWGPYRVPPLLGNRYGRPCWAMLNTSSMEQTSALFRGAVPPLNTSSSCLSLSGFRGTLRALRPVARPQP